MKIDTHQHFWRYKASDFPWISERMPTLLQDRLPEHRASAMQATGVTAALAIQARNDSAETDYLLAIASRYPDVLGVVGWADLGADNLECSLESWCSHDTFKGLRHILQDEPDVAAWVGGTKIKRGLQLLQKREIVYEVLVYDRQLPEVIDFCSRHDRHWLVLDHIGKPALRNWNADLSSVGVFWRRSLRELAAFEHVMCKLSGLATETDWSATGGLTLQDRHNIFCCLDVALELFGPQRLLFGTDWPVCELAAPYEAIHGLVKEWADARLTATEQQGLWGMNALRCYGLELPFPYECNDILKSHK